MDALIVCACSHSIVAHENGRCNMRQCACVLGSFTVLDDEIDRIKLEHALKTGQPTSGDALAAFARKKRVFDS